MFPILNAFGLEKLTVPERMQLVDELCDSIAADEDQVPLTDAQHVDLQRRLDAIDADPGRGSSWEAVKARLMSAK